MRSIERRCSGCLRSEPAALRSADCPRGRRRQVRTWSGISPPKPGCWRALLAGAVDAGAAQDRQTSRPRDGRAAHRRDQDPEPRAGAGTAGGGRQPRRRTERQSFWDVEPNHRGTCPRPAWRSGRRDPGWRALCGRRRVDDRVVLRGSAHVAASRRNRHRGPGGSAWSTRVSVAARTRAAGSGQTAAALRAAHAAGALLGSVRRSGRPAGGTPLYNTAPGCQSLRSGGSLVGSRRLDSSRSQLVCRPAASGRARLGPDCRPAGPGKGLGATIMDRLRKASSPPQGASQRHG